MPGDSTGATGRIERFLLDELRLDWQNPRLPEHMNRREATQDELLLYIDRSYEPLDIARSIARHGYFESEPLIGVREDEAITIVEGNRRLVALRGLLRNESRALLRRQTRGWARLPIPEEASGSLPYDFPVLIVEDRDQIAPLLGYRHISGIAPWEPLAQARYIWHLVDEAGYTFDEVAEVVGRDLTEVRSMYRDHEILRQAREMFDLDVSTVEANFGVFNRAMTTQNLRAFISAPAPAAVETANWPLPEDAGPALGKLINWIFGDQGEEPVISDSRQLNALGKAVVDERGREELERSRSLEVATEAIGDPRERFNKQLARARDRLLRAVEIAPRHLSREAAELLAECAAALEELHRRPGG